VLSTEFVSFLEHPPHCFLVNYTRCRPQSARDCRAKESHAVDVVPALVTISHVPRYGHQKEHNLPALTVPPINWTKGPEVSSLEREAPLATLEF